MLSKRKPVKDDECYAKPGINPLTGGEFSYRYAILTKTRKGLPIWSHEHAIVSSIKKEKVVMIKGETGCGKSTQIIHMLINEGYHQK